MRNLSASQNLSFFTLFLLFAPVLLIAETSPATPSPTSPTIAKTAFGTPNCQTEVEFTCNQYAVEIFLTDANKIEYEAELVFTFEDPMVPPNAESICVTAEIVDLEDAQWDTRLPQGFFLIPDFPILINVEPGPPPNGIIFQGGFTIDLETDNLDFDGEATYRLMQSPTDGNFQDATRNFGLGSYRVRGSSGQFSDFILAADLRPFGVVMGQKYQRFNTSLSDLSQGIDPQVKIALGLINMASEAAFDAGDLDGAIDQDDILIDTIEIETENDNIDDDFTGPGGQSVAGVLFGQAVSIGLSLEVATLPRSPESIGREEFLITDGGKELLVRVGFSGQQSFSLDELIITAQDVNPQDAALLARMPDDVSIPEDFPVLLEITPSSTVQQAFAGQLVVDLQTEDLAFRADTPLRL